VILFRKRRFADVIERQLALFGQDERGLLDEAEEARERYTEAAGDEAEELYGDYLLVVDACAERLADLRDAFAATLAEKDAEEYERAFNRAVAERWPDFGVAVEES
jgi:hypothetical protein